MKRTLYAVLVFTFNLGLTSCDKDDKDINEALPAISAEATMTRTLDFTLLGTEKDTTYADKERIKATARFGDDAPLLGSEKNVFLMTIDAGPGVTTDGAGDFVQFVIERANLKTGYVGTYQLGAPSSVPLKHIRYAYISNKVSGAYNTNLTGTNMGNSLTGELKITHYDAARNTLSGTYTIAGKLYADPTDFSTATELDEECDVTVSGTFANVKIKQD